MEFAKPVLLLLSLGLLVACGSDGGDDDDSSGGGGGGGGGGGSVLPNHTVTAADTSENTARLADLNGFRDECGGTAHEAVGSHNSLIISAVRHAGWQAIRNAGLNHGEPESNALFSDDSLSERIRKANGGTHLTPSWAYYEDIASNSGTSAMVLLWNSVYHRIPMMRHKARNLGYGDKVLAANDYPTAGISAGNGFATLNWHELTSPTISVSYWPGVGTTAVPTTFYSNSESPDPVAGRNGVGCPIHLIVPQTSGNVTALTATLVTGGTTHINMMALISSGSPTNVSGDDVISITTDGKLDPGEVFLIPVPTGADAGAAGGLKPSTTYTCQVSVTVNGTTYNVTDISYTTAASP